MIFSVSIVFVLLNIGHLWATDVDKICDSYQGKQFCFMQEPMNYTAADLLCKSMDMSLVKIDNAELDGWLFSNSNAQNGHLWIGLNDLNTESKFVWSDGSALDNYQNWNDTQPDDSRQNEDCAHIKTNGKWNDLPCFLKLKVVCERPSIDGGYSKWSEWSSCGKTCGEGIRNRSRSCDNPEPMYGGKQCEGPPSETSVCNMQSCISDTQLCEMECARKGCIGSDVSSGNCSCSDCSRDVSGCVFPFTFEEKTYYTCTEVSKDRPWCSTTSQHNGDYKYCDKYFSNCELHGGKSYHFSDKRVNFSDAEAICSSKGLKMVHILNSDTNTWLQIIINRKKYEGHFWIGLSDRAKEGTFVWNDGQALSYRAWLMYRPLADNHYGNRPQDKMPFDCVYGQINKKIIVEGIYWSWQLDWLNALCDRLMPYICEGEGGC